MLWWITIIISVAAFFILLIGYYVVKKLNESLTVESVGLREGTSVSTQVSLVIDKGDRNVKKQIVNLKEDKRSKSASLISSIDKPTAISDITCGVKTKQVDDGIKTSSSSNLHKRFYNPIEPFPSDKSNMNVAYAKSLTGLNMDLHKLPEDKKTINNEKIKTSQNSINILKTNAGLHEKNAIKIEHEHSARLENEAISRCKIENIEHSVKTKESAKNIPFSNLSEAESNNGVVMKKQKYSIDNSLPILDDANGIRIIETIQPETSSLEVGAIYDTPIQKCEIDNSPATAGNVSELKNTESIKEKLSNRVYGAIFGPKQISANEICKSYDSPIKIGVANEVKNIDDLQRVPSLVIGDIRHMPSEKRELETTTSPLTTRDAIKEKNVEAIQKEPSSLFFGAICGTPATPKELMERYEIAFTSANNSSINITSSTKAKSTNVNSKENLSTSISRVTFNPETKTSYIESILKETPYTMADFSATKLSDTNSKLNEFTQTKESGVSKCTSKVTFAKNTEIVIKDSTSSIANHVCVITPLKIDFTNDSETVCSNDFDLDSANNLDAFKDNKDNERKNPYNRKFINEIVTVPEITYKINSNRILNADSDDIYINNDIKSQISFNLQCENIHGTNVYSQITQFDSKLPTKSSIPPKSEASTSKSNNTSGYPEVVVINNKFCGDIKCTRRKLDNIASENKFDNPKSKRVDDKDFEVEDNLLQTASLDRFDFLLAKKGTDEDPKDLNSDVTK